MNLAELALDLAEYAQGVEEYPVTTYNPATLSITSASLSGRTGEYGGGTLWFVDSNGVINARIIKSASGSSLTIDSPFPIGETINTILITPSMDFDLPALESAINTVLTVYPIMGYDESLQFHRDVHTYDLPEQVTNDIRRVEILQHAYNCQYYEVSYYWKLDNRKLVIYGLPYRYEELAPIRISFVKPHGRRSIHEEIDPSVNKEYIRYMGYMNLYRNQIQKRHKDNPIAMDLFNESKNYEQQFFNRHIPEVYLLKKDMTIPYWE